MQKCQTLVTAVHAVPSGEAVKLIPQVATVRWPNRELEETTRGHGRSSPDQLPCRRLS